MTKFVAAVPTGPTDRARDRELLARVARGDVAALRSLYDQHAPRAITIAFRILRNREEAEDIVQETFLEVWRRAAQFDPGRGGAVAWVVTIARSRAIDRLRARTIAGRTIASAAKTPDGLSPVAAALARGGDGAPPRRTPRRGRAGARCRPRSGAPSSSPTSKGLSQSEIAAKTGSPLGTVKMRVKLAMAKLAALLGRTKEHMIHRHQMTCAQFVGLADAFALGRAGRAGRAAACARHISADGATTSAAGGARRPRSA